MLSFFLGHLEDPSCSVCVCTSRTLWFVQSPGELGCGVGPCQPSEKDGGWGSQSLGEMTLRPYSPPVLGWDKCYLFSVDSGVERTLGCPRTFLASLSSSEPSLEGEQGRPVMCSLLKGGGSWGLEEAAQRLEGLQDPGPLSCLIPSQAGWPLTPPSVTGACWKRGAGPAEPAGLGASPARRKGPSSLSRGRTLRCPGHLLPP